VWGKPDQGDVRDDGAAAQGGRPAETKGNVLRKKAHGDGKPAKNLKPTQAVLTLLGKTCPCHFLHHL
jgi:hypothetical protein